jgi:hypothetical protein
LFYFAREAAGATGTRHSPRPLIFRERDVPANLARTRGEIAKLWLLTSLMFEIEVGVHANTLVMPGLDPGIHPSSQEVLSKRMDCRVKPGNDALTPFARPVGSQ